MSLERVELVEGCDEVLDADGALGAGVYEEVDVVGVCVGGTRAVFGSVVMGVELWAFEGGVDPVPGGALFPRGLFSGGAGNGAVPSF